uniref:Serine/arginine repetitive matrix protein 1-like n=1 Tax=Diabrotica virgifera virgifera TaxID=50390 RepID=A0A6P7EYL8_DIAVI
MDRPRIIPVAQAPPQVVYAPAQNNCPYPIGPPSGHPAMPPLPLLRSLLDHDHNRARSNPELCRNSSESHVLSYDRRKPGRPNSSSNVSSEHNSHRRYNPAPISMPFPETALERRPGRPHSSSNVSTNRNSPIRYPPASLSMPFPKTPSDRRPRRPHSSSNVSTNRNSPIRYPPASLSMPFPKTPSDRRPRRPHSSSNVSTNRNSPIRYPPASLSMPFPKTPSDRRPRRPHSSSNVSTNRNSPIRYPPATLSMPFPEPPLDRRIEYSEHRTYPTEHRSYPPEHRSYPPEPPPRTTSQLLPETPLQVEDHQFVRSMTLPSNYRARTAPSAPLAPEENFSLADGNINHELPPPSYDDVMQEIRHERARSMINRR